MHVVAECQHFYPFVVELQVQPVCQFKRDEARMSKVLWWQENHPENLERKERTVYPLRHAMASKLILSKSK